MQKFVSLTIAILLSCSLLTACGSKQEESSFASGSKTEKVSGHKTTDKEKGMQQKSKKVHKKSTTNKQQLEINYENYKLKGQKDYAADFTDKSWAGTKVVIDKVQIAQVESQEYDSANDGKFDVNGFARLHMQVTPSRDINFYPTQGTAIYNDGQQQEATGNESWDGEIAKGATKDGWISFPIKELNDPTALTSLRLKFTADYDTDDYDDDGAYQDYDLTLELK